MTPEALEKSLTSDLDVLFWKLRKRERRESEMHCSSFFTKAQNTSDICSCKRGHMPCFEFPGYPILTAGANTRLKRFSIPYCPNKQHQRCVLTSTVAQSDTQSTITRLWLGTLTGWLSRRSTRLTRAAILICLFRKQLKGKKSRLSPQTLRSPVA